MNTELIRRLAEQAGMNIVDDKFSTYGRFAEKLTELIVQECIEQIRGEWLPVMESKEMMNIPHWEGYTQCGVDSVIAIREHFGIENEY
jgi:hypothetical protein